MRFQVLGLLFMSTIASCHYAASDLVYVPDHPGYEEDVRPLFSDHCVVCHGHPSARGAPNTFRLDVYDATDGIPGALVYGGSALADIKSQRMPPAAKDGDGVGPNGLRMLQRWVDDGMPKTRP
jgi:hypothetical protein